MDRIIWPTNDMSDIDQADTEFVVEPATKLKSFAAAEMVQCEQCSRPNAPTRSTCLYCGAQLPSGESASAAKQIDEAPADTLQHTLFITGDQLPQLTSETRWRLANLLDVKADDLSNPIAAGGPLPLTITSSTLQAQRILAAIQELGLQASILSEDALTTSSARKIRGLALSESSISALPRDASDQESAWSDLSLIVVGRLVTTRVEVDEKRQRKDAKPIDSRQFSSDESVADIYLTGKKAWRICADNFDYSCLGNRAATGFENFRRLLELMQERAPQAEMDDSYARKRLLLAKIWPVEEESRQDVLFGARRRHRQSITTSNESQFNRYSRAAWLLKMISAEVMT